MIVLIEKGWTLRPTLNLRAEGTQETKNPPTKKPLKMPPLKKETPSRALR